MSKHLYASRRNRVCMEFLVEHGKLNEFYDEGLTENGDAIFSIDFPSFESFYLTIEKDFSFENELIGSPSGGGNLGEFDQLAEINRNRSNDDITGFGRSRIILHFRDFLCF